MAAAPDNDGILDERLYVAQDANYNVTALFDISGTIVERYVYAPYGVATILAPDWSVRLESQFAWQHLHQGLRIDPLTGLYHNRARDYSPTLMRFVSTDPIWATNLYAAYGNGPTGRVDPSGLYGRTVLTMSYEEMTRRGLDSNSWAVILFATWMKTPVEWYRSRNTPYAANERELLRLAGLAQPENYELVRTPYTIPWFYESTGEYRNWNIPVYVVRDRRTGAIVRVAWPEYARGVQVGYVFFNNEAEMRREYEMTVGLMLMLPAL